MRWLRDLSLCFLTLFPMAACSNSHSSTTPTKDAEPAVTLENVCYVLPTRYCQQDSPCCTKAGLAFDQTGCEGFFRQTCLQGVTAVAAHTATFNPADIDACIAAYQPFIDKCSLTAADFASVALNMTPCQQVFLGNVAIGGACSSDAECAPGAAPNTTFCGTGSCQSRAPLAAQGEACVDTLACALGLVCDSTQQCAPDPQPEFFVGPQGCNGSADAGP
jgi:hypothetical protein